MTFHLVALPHTNVSKEHSACAFNQKVMKFGQMMVNLGHKIYLYSSEKYDPSACTEHITCITEEERVACLEGKHYTEASFDYNKPHWKKFNNQVIGGIATRIEDKDFICVIGGLAHKRIADVFPDNITVEFGIGYSGTFSKYRVFESYAWMHTVYGEQQRAQNAHGFFYDAVIPSYFNPDDFPLVKEKEDYLLFLGRLTGDKGLHLSRQIAEKLGKKLILAGPKGPDYQDGYGEYVGEADSVKRGELMSKASALLCPSLYIEPFGSVAVEAQLCGTPVISTDWGAFVETVEQKKTGFRCRSFKEFCDAVARVKELDPTYIAQRAVAKYSMQVVAIRYDEYFTKLLTVWGKGFYA